MATGSGRVLVVGGNGFFGRLLIDDLQRYNRCRIVVASRRPLHSNSYETVVADLHDPASLRRALQDVDIAICAAGPFQTLPLSLAEACLERGIHYLDLADDRSFVRRVRSTAVSHGNGVSAVCTGWSTVPALSGLLARMAAGGNRKIDSIHIHMAPGNRGARRRATIASLMHSVGREFTVCTDGVWRTVRGWSEPRDFTFPSPVGKRRGYLVDVPDHEIFPDLFGSRTVEFRAGSELQILNECLSLLRKTGRTWFGWSGMLQRAAAMLSWIGHDCGAIAVEACGKSKQCASIVADSRAERIAVMPASVMTGLLLSGDGHHGLVSCTEWLTEQQLRNECEKRSFRLIVEER